MLDLIIDAYEEKTKDKNFFHTIKKLDNISKFFLVFMLLDFITVAIMVYFGQYKSALVTIGIFVVVLIVVLYFINKNVEMKWEKHIEKYNENLDTLVTILKQENINCFTKEKIEQLIRKCQEKIDEYNKQKNKLKEGKNNVLEKGFLPIIAFVSGVIAKNINVKDAIVIATIAGIMIVYLLTISYGFDCMTENISGNRLEKTKHMKELLEDLSIRGI